MAIGLNVRRRECRLLSQQYLRDSPDIYSLGWRCINNSRPTFGFDRPKRFCDFAVLAKGDRKK